MGPSAAYFRYDGDIDKADYIEKLLEHGKEYLGMAEKVFDEVTRNDSLFSEKEQHYRWLSDMRTMMSEAERNGRAEGEKAGEIAKQRTIAVKMLSMGMEIAVIAEATGLNEAEIELLDK